MPVLAFSHVAIRVGDLDAALAFWRDRLGFHDRSLLVVADTPSFREAGLTDAEMVAHFLHRDGTVIELQMVRSRSGRPVPAHLSLLGYRHLAFRVDGVQATATAMADAGGRVDWPTLTANDGVGGSAIFGADPDGQRLELLQLAGGPTQPVGDALPDSGPGGDGTVDRFDHVAVGVRDVDRTIGFFTTALGATFGARTATGAALRVFDTRIVLEQADERDPRLGIRALCFRGLAEADLADPDGTPIRVR